MALGKPLTNFQIEDKIKSVKCFKGVFPKNVLPKKINKLERGIVNNAGLPGNGTHLGCYYNHPENKYIEFFDSFGLTPAKEIQRNLLTSNKDIMYNSSQIQDVLSIKCEYFCIDYIKDRLSGLSQYDSIHKYSINLPYINDNLFVICTKTTDTLNLVEKVSKNNRNMLQGRCKVCNTKKSSVLSLRPTTKVKKK